MNPAELVLRIAPGALDEWVSTQRWFASKARDLVRVEVLEAVPLPGSGAPGEPALVIALVEAVFHAGTHERYQLPLALHPAASADAAATLAVVDGFAVVDAVRDPYAGSALGRLVVEGGVADAPAGSAQVSFHHHATVVLPPVDEVRALAAEQSNSSIVYRRDR